MSNCQRWHNKAMSNASSDRIAQYITQHVELRQHNEMPVCGSSIAFGA
jgi:hypothetical protein